jgi:hypothetical protein
MAKVTANQSALLRDWELESCQNLVCTIGFIIMDA